MKNKFVRCLSPITAGVTLAMLIAVAFNGYYSVTKIIQSPDWKTAVYLFVELELLVPIVVVSYGSSISKSNSFIKVSLSFERLSFIALIHWSKLL